MQIIPAIDLMNGCCVRLKQGVQDSKKEYLPPADAAKRWQAAGASLLHVVNLDGAFGQANANRQIIVDLITNQSLAIQLGGGIRSLATAADWLDLGVSRVILGTLAALQVDAVGEAVRRFGADRVVVGVDAREDRIAIRGWLESSEKELLPFVRELESHGLRRIIYTDVARDGEHAGPNLAKLDQLCANTALQVIASGGFSKSEHFQSVVDLQHANLEGVILGTALYEGALDLAALIEQFQ